MIQVHAGQRPMALEFVSSALCRNGSPTGAGEKKKREKKNPRVSCEHDQTGTTVKAEAGKSSNRD